MLITGSRHYVRLSTAGEDLAKEMKVVLIHRTTLLHTLTVPLYKLRIFCEDNVASLLDGSGIYTEKEISK